PKPADITRAWRIVDADGLVLGRLATEVAAVLRGKHKAMFTPNLDTGDHVIVVNADKVVLTSGKAETKLAYRHSGYPGGLTATRYSDLMVEHSDQVVRNAITGMLPKTRLGRQMATKLKVYTGAEHPHAAQSPVPLELPDARRTASARSGA
ncbi:MAG: 50S ribosomal protein L13, partial [Acidimicrobiales bacterium]